MAKIKIKDLPKDMKITREEMEALRGGFQPQPEPPGLDRYVNSSRNRNLLSNLHRTAEPLLAEGG